jgi:hypothetical protein
MVPGLDPGPGREGGGLVGLRTRVLGSLLPRHRGKTRSPIGMLPVTSGEGGGLRGPALPPWSCSHLQPC